MKKKPIPQTSTAAVQSLRERRAELGIKQLNVYAHVDDHFAIKKICDAFLQRRLK